MHEPTETDAPARLHRDDDGIAWIHLDDPGKSVNTLSTRLFSWFQEVMPGLEADPPRALVLLSDKVDHFMAGADIEELERLEDSAEVYELLREGHAFLGDIAQLPHPVIAAVHGACLGGGLELALACDAIVATEHAKTRFGFPEVQLGLFPGMGGTQRLPRRIGTADALDLILTGRQISAGRGRSLGLVDETCAPEQLPLRARRLVERARHGRLRRRGPVGLGRRATHLASRIPGLRRLVFGRARRTVLERTGGHYPAPLEAIRVVRDGLNLSLEAALDLEARAFSKLVVSDQARRLMGIFFMKNEVEDRAAALAEKTRPLGAVGILGAGFMGSGIAQVLAHRGIDVVMKDRDQPSLEKGLDFCRRQFDELEEKRKLTGKEAEVARARVRGTVTYDELRDVDFVIEAVFEDLGVKHQVLRELEEAAPETLIFASNTSSIPIARIAEASRRPERVVGIHFFSPVHRMPLVEVIRTPQSAEEAVATAVEVSRRMGKTTIVVGDGPGFFTTRVLAPFVNEAAWCLTEGASIEQIDRALTGWGWPVGPMALLDEVGLDVAQHAAETLVAALGERLEPPEAFARLIEDGRKGRKTGRGFYRYGDDGKEVDDEVYRLLGWQRAELEDEEIAERCWLQMLNETARCLDEGIIEEPNDVDIGVIFAFGFPPFRGGLLRHADTVGVEACTTKLARFAERHGPRFEPAPLLERMAREKRRFREEGRAYGA